jgi:DNA-binding CsgD family transcriptional regulator
MIQKILELKKEKSLYEIALDMEVSESSLYNYINNYRKLGKKTLEKIRAYFERRAKCE